VSYWYLATPYTNNPDRLEGAHARACVNAAKLLDAGIDVYSPIAEMHCVAKYTTADAKDGAYWQRICKSRMETARGLIFCKMLSWEKSEGMFKELVAFLQAGKPVVFMEDGVVPSEADFARAENRYKPDFRALPDVINQSPPLPSWHPDFPQPVHLPLTQWPNPLMHIGQSIPIADGSGYNNTLAGTVTSGDVDDRPDPTRGFGYGG